MGATRSVWHIALIESECEEILRKTLGAVIDLGLLDYLRVPACAAWILSSHNVK